jgi:hypothetical protein
LFLNPIFIWGTAILCRYSEAAQSWKHDPLILQNTPYRPKTAFKRFRKAIWTYLMSDVGHRKTMLSANSWRDELIEPRHWFRTHWDKSWGIRYHWMWLLDNKSTTERIARDAKWANPELRFARLRNQMLDPIVAYLKSAGKPVERNRLARAICNQGAGPIQRIPSQSLRTCGLEIWRFIPATKPACPPGGTQ